MKNLKEFKALIERYESITLEEIEDNWVIAIDSLHTNAELTANKLTGYGNSNDCSLCKLMQRYKSGIVKCDQCVYVKTTGNECNDGYNEETYNAIEFAKTKKQLLIKIKARAKHMRTILDQINETN